MDYKILIVDDSKACASFAECAVRKIAEPKSVVSLSDARKTLSQDTHWDLIMLDIELGDGSGLDYLYELQSNPKLSRIPIILLSSHADISKKVLAFSLGAQDYLVKPYNLFELEARMKRVLQLNNEKNKFIVFGELKISPHQLFAITKEDHLDKKIDLSPKEYLLLKFLISHPEKVFSRQQLLDAIWGDDLNVTDRTVDSHIYSVRKKLGTLSEYIESVRGLGYQMTLANPEHSNKKAV